VSLAHAADVAPVQTAVHRLAPQCKVAALVAFVLSVALVPHGVAWPYALDAALLGVVAVAARVPAGLLARRLVIEIPFVLFVVVLPFAASGPTVDVLGLSLSQAGLWTAFGIAAKATLAVLATGVLAATTPAPEILIGLERLHVPRQLVAIAGFAIRYLQVVLDELRRVNTARVARGHDARWLWQARAVAQSTGTLAVRCLNRGERVHGAMLARGWDGRMPSVGGAGDAGRLALTLTVAAALPALAATAAARGGLA
jgi:cobalt/nickel transport system permease protein